MPYAAKRRTAVAVTRQSLEPFHENVIGDEEFPKIISREWYMNEASRLRSAWLCYIVSLKGAAP